MRLLFPQQCVPDTATRIPVGFEGGLIETTHCRNDLQVPADLSKLELEHGYIDFAVRLLLILDKGTLPRINTIAIDTRMLGFACALAVLIAIALSFLPGPVRAQELL